MKILMVSMNSIHFRRWTSQLEDFGHEVFWFDALGAEGSIKELPWVTQKTDWRLRFKTGRYALKKVPGTKFINQRSIENGFEKYIKEIQPDVVHSFAFQVSVIPILNVLKKYANCKWIVSSWGSDVYFFDKLGISETKLKDALKRIDYIFTDCLRDEVFLKNRGFTGDFLGVFPGNGGIDYPTHISKLSTTDNRKKIFIKAYDDGIGKGDIIIKAVLNIPEEVLKGFTLVFLGTNTKSTSLLKQNKDKLNMQVYPRNKPVDNARVLRLLEESLIYIGNSISDGIPNMLLEAMGNGAFPIQSNPGNATKEVITHELNGLLIQNPLDHFEIKKHILRSLSDTHMLNNSFDYNIKKIRARCNREVLRKKIHLAYETVV